ncbi:MAG: hypothetical protein ABIZ81_09030 [Opitutaceae bacterium]
MKRFLSSVACVSVLALSVNLHAAEVAKNAVRQNVNGIDLVVLKTGVQEVVTIRGSLPAGDSRSPDNNPAIATLAGGMLDKGTKQHDKFAIAQLLGDVGATINFSVGPAP